MGQVFGATNIGTMTHAKLAESEIPRTERAWAAGFFDGEGCFCSTKKVGQYQQQVVIASVTQKKAGEELLTRFQKAVGGLGRVKTFPSQREIWRWTSTSFGEIMTVAGALWPYLGPVKKAAFKKLVEEYTAYGKERILARQAAKA